MSATTVHLYSEFDALQINADKEGAVWIRSRHATVSLTLDAADRTKLRAALAAVTTAEQRVAPPEIIHGNRDIHDPTMQAEAAQANVRG